MAHNEAMTVRVRKALAHRKDVEEKKMFRGVAFMVDGKMCLSVGDTRMMCRIDPEAHDNALTKKGVETVIMKGRKYKGYIYVQEEAMRSEKDFEHWVALALDFNGRAKATKQRK
jgi:TfoX/Sxy family transcriptional regulator of competence genes